MKIIGIDPGLNCTGWGIIKKESQLSYINSGVLKTSNKQSLEERLHLLHKGLLQVLTEYQPDVAAIEETFVNKNAQSSLLLAHARGALLVTCMISGIKSIHHYSANHIKKTVTGNGHAEKQQMINMLKYLVKDLTISNITHDIADAIAIALCHGYHIT